MQPITKSYRFCLQNSWVLITELLPLQPHWVVQGIRHMQDMKVPSAALPQSSLPSPHSTVFETLTREWGECSKTRCYSSTSIMPSRSFLCPWAVSGIYLHKLRAQPSFLLFALNISIMQTFFRFCKRAWTLSVLHPSQWLSLYLCLTNFGSLFRSRIKHCFCRKAFS